MKNNSPASRKITGILEKEARKMHQMLPLYEENGVYNFYLKLGKQGAISALQTTPKTKLEEMTKEDLIALVKEITANPNSRQVNP